jgi:addiction module HigA family antidote
MQNMLLSNPHAGDILKYEFLEELNLSESDLAVAIAVPEAIIQNIVQGKSGMTADIDLRLSRYFGLSEGYFLRLQNAYELMEAKRRLGDSLNQIIPLAI